MRPFQCLLLALALCAVAAPSVQGSAAVVGAFIDNWEAEPLLGSPPSKDMEQFSAVAFGNDVVMFGGRSASDVEQTLVVFESASGTWRSEVHNEAIRPGKLYGQIAVASSKIANTFFMFGGCVAHTAGTCTSISPLASVWEFTYSPPGNGLWTRHNLASYPFGRYAASAALWHDATVVDEADSEYIVFFGGETGGSSDVLTHFFQTSTKAISSQAGTGDVPPQLADAAILIEGDYMYLFGGYDVDTGIASNALYKQNLQTYVWTLVTTTGTPAARAGMAFMPVLGEMLLIHGGRNPTGAQYADTFIANLTEAIPAWTSLATHTGVELANAASTALNGNLFVAGGAVGATTAAAALSGDAYSYFTRPYLYANTPAVGKNCGGYRMWVVGRQFLAGGADHMCRFGTVTVGAMRVNSTHMYCDVPQPDIVDASDAYAKVFVHVSVRDPLFTTDNTDVMFQYEEDESSTTTTGPLELPEGTAGLTSEFQIQTRSHCGIIRATEYRFPPSTLTNDNVTARAVDINNVNNAYQLAVSYDADGRYDVDFATTIASTYRIDMTLNDVALPQPSPQYQIVVVPDVPVAAASSLTGVPSESTAGHAITFGITSFDVYANPIIDGTQFEVLAVLYDDQGNPTFTSVQGSVSYTTSLVATVGESLVNAVSVAGTWRLSVRTKHDNALIAEHTITVNPGPWVVSETTASGFGTSFAHVAEPATLTVTPRDTFGNAAPTPGIDFVMELTGTFSANGTVTEDPDNPGIYLATYVSRKVGQYAIQITYNEQPIQGSPFSVTVLLGNVQSVERSYAEGSGVAGGVAGKRQYFTIHARDPFDNPVTRGGLNLTIVTKVSDSNFIVDNNDGTYTASYLPKHLGHFGDQVLCVQQDGVNIMGSPFNITIDYGWAFFVIVFFAVLIAAIILAVACTWGANYAHREYLHRRFMRHPEEVFPAVEHDEEDPHAPWAMDDDYQRDIDIDPADPDAGVPMSVLATQNAGIDPSFNDFVADIDQGDAGWVDASDHRKHVDANLDNINRV